MGFKRPCKPVKIYFFVSINTAFYQIYRFYDYYFPTIFNYFSNAGVFYLNLLII
ncbi:hypothetical protein BAZOLSSOX_1250 [uncultured Gammaproteobacteria bacterium]|nr:hypothetical protein BAZOLSSOX_1255 [uncultured Gammaproteobacteria bacterium]VVH60479.1 hypothetical protein BAZOLSSOX_1250 [uncultured Gammaproteobacteria bacterium]